MALGVAWVSTWPLVRRLRIVTVAFVTVFSSVELVASEFGRLRQGSMAGGGVLRRSGQNRPVKGR